MTQEEMDLKQRMIKEIVENTDIYKSESGLQKMSFAQVKTIYDSCMILFLKKINNANTKLK